MSMSPLGVAPAASRVVRLQGTKRLSRKARREERDGYAFISPWIIGFMLFTAGPLVISLYYSFTNYSLMHDYEWLGLANYTRAFNEDYLYWTSVARTLQWVALTVPAGLLGSLVAAMLLNRAVTGIRFWRTCFFLPSLTPAVAAGVLWMWVLNPDIGIANAVIRQIFGVAGPKWLSTAKSALPTLALISIWTEIGGQRMLIFLAALQGVPDELYDAAEVDGATGIRRILHVTIPMISPSILLNAVLSVIHSMQVFGLALVATKGGPAHATYFYAMHIYYSAFRYLDMAYGCALAWLFFIAILLLTVLQMRLSNRWVYYASS